MICSELCPLLVKECTNTIKSKMVEIYLKIENYQR